MNTASKNTESQAPAWLARILSKYKTNQQTTSNETAAASPTMWNVSAVPRVFNIRRSESQRQPMR